MFFSFGMGPPKDPPNSLRLKYGLGYLLRAGVGENAASPSFFYFGATSYVAATQTEGKDGNDGSYRGFMDYNADKYGVQVERLEVGRNFNPEIGFVRRHGAVADTVGCDDRPIVVAERIDIVLELAGTAEARSRAAELAARADSRADAGFGAAAGAPAWVGRPPAGRTVGVLTTGANGAGADGAAAGAAASCAFTASTIACGMIGFPCASIWTGRGK